MAGRHVVLVGPMGSGKTTVGRVLAARLGRELLDNDDLLERSAGRTAAAIARAEGIDALHTAEVVVLIGALDTDDPAVITAAASTIEDAGVRARLHADAFVVRLRASAAVLAARTAAGGDATHRPDALADTVARVDAQAAVRDHWFADVADATVDTERSLDATVGRIAALLPHP